MPRDERISTHVALVARAFGANRMIYSGQHDTGLETSVARLAEQWGGDFSVTYEKNFRKVIRDHKENGFVVLHLTMYAIPITEVIAKLKAQNPNLDKQNEVLLPMEQNAVPSGAGNGKLLIVVGSQAVPGDIWELADFNISVTNQPHSEVGALAITLDRLMNGMELEREFDQRFKGKVKIEPSEKGKKVLRPERITT